MPTGPGKCCPRMGSLSWPSLCRSRDDITPAGQHRNGETILELWGPTRTPADPSSCSCHGAHSHSLPCTTASFKCELSSHAGSAACTLPYIYVTGFWMRATLGRHQTTHVKYGDPPVYKSQTFTHSCTQLTSSTQDSQACSSTAALMTFQMPPAIRPFDPNHWLCGSSPLPSSSSASDYHPVSEGSERDRKPTRRSVPICLQRCTRKHTCSPPSAVLAHSAPMCYASLFWPAQQASAGFPPPTARSKLPRAQTTVCFLQDFQLLPLSLWQWPPFHEECQGRLSECYSLFASCLLHSEMLLCHALPCMPCCAAHAPP